MEQFIDLRGRTREIENGHFEKHQPIRKIDRCFEVENVSWTIEYLLHGITLEIVFASGSNERNFRSEYPQLFKE